MSNNLNEELKRSLQIQTKYCGIAAKFRDSQMPLNNTLRRERQLDAGMTSSTAQRRCFCVFWTNNAHWERRNIAIISLFNRPFRLTSRFVTTRKNCFTLWCRKTYESSYSMQCNQQIYLHKQKLKKTVTSHLNIHLKHQKLTEHQQGQNLLCNKNISIKLYNLNIKMRTIVLLTTLIACKSIKFNVPWDFKYNPFLH